jgi:hypothetical protein
VDLRDSDAHEIALELLKQIITLASGVIALSAAFIDKFGTSQLSIIVILGMSWVSLLISISCGLQGMSAIVKSRLNLDNEWSKGKNQKYSRASKVAFVIGMCLFAVYALLLFIVKNLSS